MNASWKFISLLSTSLLLSGLVWFWATPVQATTLPDKFPRVANYFLDPTISDSEAEQLSQWDVVVVGFETYYTSPNAFKIMRQNNPDIIILAYVASEEVSNTHLAETDTNNPEYQLYNQLNSNDDWFLKNTSGDYLSFWTGTRMINVTGEWKTVLPKFMTHSVLKAHPTAWDGVYYDNCFNDISWIDNKVDLDLNGQADNWNTADAAWSDGMTTMMKRTRNLNPHALIICNSNGNYYNYINGRLIEAFPSSFDGNWTGSMQKYFDVMDTAKQPSMVIVNTLANSSDSTNYQLMRYNLTSTLLGDGFASFDQSVSAHNSLWWYDEYSVALGDPLAEAYNVATNQGPSSSNTFTEGVWRRNFQRGIVLINSSSVTKTVQLEDGFEKILGTQDTTVNNGKLVGSVKIPAHDGIILQGRIAQVVNAPYSNGTFASVFNASGDTTRNSFFSYNSAYAGSNQVVYLEDVNKTVVAGRTSVDVYSGSTKIASFNPYGSSFSGGVNIAVARLNGDKKGYKIVTGTQVGGAQVRIFNIKGVLKNTGCFPYGTSFSGGVNVAIGNVQRKTKAKEIVVAPGHGGGPQIMILNNVCKTLTTGWFAYDQNLHSGVSVAVGDVNNDGKDDIITIPGQGGAPYVRIFNGRGKELSPGFYAFSQSNTSGAQVAVTDVDGDGKNELVAMSLDIFNQ